jgi:hypothetical protein
MDYYGYPYVALTGGGDGALDSLDGSLLKDGDFSVVVDAATRRTYIFSLDEDSGETDDGFNVIAPDSNAGLKRWIRTNSPTDPPDVSFYGAVGDGSTDDTTALQDAIDATSGILKFPVGNYDYKITAALTIDQDSTCKGIELPAGSSISVSGTTAAVIASGTKKGSTTLASDATAGDTDIAVTSAANIAIGDHLFIFHTTPVNQVDVGIVTNVVSTTVSLDTPLSYSWTSSDGVTIDSVTPVKNFHIYGGGKIQNLTASNSDNLVQFLFAWGCTCELMELAQRQGTSRPLLFSSQNSYGTAYCKAIRNRILEASENGIETYKVSFGNEITGNIIEKAGTAAAGHGISIRGARHIAGYNVVKSALYDGINAGSGADIIIIGNQVSGATQSGYAGIAVSTSSIKNVQVVGNRCVGNDFGFRCYDATPGGAEGICVDGNNFNGNISGPMSVIGGMQVTFSGNTPTNRKVFVPTTATSGTNATALFTYTVPKYTFGGMGGIRVKFRILVTGSTAAKTIVVSYGGSTVFTSYQQYNEAGFHDIDLTILSNNGFTDKRTAWVSMAGVAAIEANSGNAYSETTTEDKNLVVTGTCADGGDSMSVYTVEINPIGQAL